MDDPPTAAPGDRQSSAALILLYVNQESDYVCQRFAQDRRRWVTQRDIVQWPSSYGRPGCNEPVTPKVVEWLRSQTLFPMVLNRVMPQAFELSTHPTSAQRSPFFKRVVCIIDTGSGRKP